jgi:putative transposase
MSPRWEPNPNIRRGRTVIHTLHADLVFTPRYRRGPFTDALTRFEEIMRAVCADFDTELVEFNGERDHVQLLVHYPPKVAISRLVGSSRASQPAGPPGVPRTHPHVPVGRPLLVPVLPRSVLRRAPPAIIKEYIDNQKRPG